MHDCHQGDETVDRKYDSPKGGVKDIRKVCQLVGRCDGHWEDVRRLWGVVTDVRNCGSSKEGVTNIRKVCHLMQRCDGHGGM